MGGVFCDRSAPFVVDMEGRSLERGSLSVFPYHFVFSFVCWFGSSSGRREVVVRRWRQPGGYVGVMAKEK